MLGMTLYNNASHLPDALESLLGADLRGLRAPAARRRVRRTARRRWRDEYVGAGSAACATSGSRPAGDDRDVARGGGDRGAGVSVRRVLRLGQRSRLVASALARDAGRRARVAIRGPCSPTRSPRVTAARRGDREGPAAVRHGRPSRPATRAGAVLPRGRGRRRHGLRPDAHGCASARRHLPDRCFARTGS